MSPGASELIGRATAEPEPESDPGASKKPSPSDEGEGYGAEMEAVMERATTALGIDKSKAPKLASIFAEWHELAHMDD